MTSSDDQLILLYSSAKNRAPKLDDCIANLGTARTLVQQSALVLDVDFHEDESRVRKDHASGTLA